MGTLNLTSLISRVKVFFANRDDLTDDDVIQYLNLAQEQMAKIWDWEEFENTTTSTFSITSDAETDKFLTLPSTLKEVTSFRVITEDGRSRKLTFNSVRAFDKQIPEPEWYARDIPKIYTVHNNKVEMWPVPDEAHTYIIRTVNWPADFEAGTPNATSDFDKKDMALIYRAVSIGWDSYGEYEKARRFYGIYKALIDVDKDEEENVPDREIKPPSETARNAGELGGQYWTDPWVRSVR